MDKHLDLMARLLPAVTWLRGYRRADLPSDAVAGLVTAILLIPQAMAYSLLAGLPPQAGLYASVAASIAYALFGSSRTLNVGPVAVTAVMVAGALAAHDGDPVAGAMVLAFECGLILLVLASLRLGAMVNFLSHPVLTGFAAGAAVLILLTQIPALLGLSGVPSMTRLDILPAIVARAATLQPVTAAVGLASVALLLIAAGPVSALLRRRGQDNTAAFVRRGAPLLVVIFAVVAVAHLDLNHAAGVAIVGAVPAGLPSPDFSWPRHDVWFALFPSALLIALVAYVQSVSMAKTLANRRRQRIDANQELAALGAANIAAAFIGGLPVAGGFARTMVNFSAGARTQLAGLYAALIITVMLYAFAPLIADLPKATLAAIVMVAVLPLIDIAGARALWRYQRSEAAVMGLTAVCVLVLGIETGLVAGVAGSLFACAWRASRPNLAVVGRASGSERYLNVKRHVVETWPRLALIRIDENLNFANIGVVEDFIAAHLSQHPRVEHLVLICGGINSIDSSALEGLERLYVQLRDAGVTLHLAEVKGAVMSRLERVQLPAHLAPGRIFDHTRDAVQAFAA